MQTIRSALAGGHRAQRVIALHGDPVGQPFAAAVARAEATAAAELSLASTRRPGRAMASAAASTPVPQPRSMARSPSGHPVQQPEQPAGAEVDPGAGEGRAVRAHPQPELGVPGLPGKAHRYRVRTQPPAVITRDFCLARPG